jgi:nitrogen fixation NifU-like protein
MTLFSLLTTASILAVVGIAWFGMHWFLNPRIKNPDAGAKITGPCGDTMELELKFNGSTVDDFYYWTDGCSISKMCIATAASLARGKTVPELKEINRSAILKEVGNLPDTHLHCAILAEMVLQKAVENYMAAGQPTHDDLQTG